MFNNKIVKYIKQNKFLFIILLIVFLILCYCSFNTFLASDDLAYSFFKRLNNRVTNIFQVIWDNLRYYKSINGRFIVHVIVMTLLIFGKNLWSILNPLVIVTILFIIYKIIERDHKLKNKENILLAIILPLLLLLLYDYKYLIYWVAGSINYLWVTLALILFCYMYFNNWLIKHKKIMYLYLFIVSSLHENSFTFLFIFMLILNIIEYIKKRQFTYIKFFIPILLGGAIVIFAPGNFKRLDEYTEWNSLNIINKLLLSIPIVSKLSFNILNVYNIIPTIYILTLVIKLLIVKKKNLITKILLSIYMIITLLCIILNSNNIYILLAIISFAVETYIRIKEKEYNYLPIQFGFYAIAFSMILTPLYYIGRSNLHLFIYFILIISKYIMDIITKLKTTKKLIVMISILSFIILSCLLLNEINIYYNIGKTYKTQLSEIEDYNNQSETNILYLTAIPDKYTKYHIDCNAETVSHWTYKYYLWYYEIREDTTIIYK